MTNIIEEQIKKNFSVTNNGLTDEILTKLAQLCEIYNLSPEELNNNWEAYIITKSSENNEINEVLIEDFRINKLQNDIEKKPINKSNDNPFSKQSNDMNIDNDNKIYNKDDINLDDLFSGIQKNRKKIIIPNNNFRSTNNNNNNPFSSPTRNSTQNYMNGLSPTRSNGLFSPTKYRNINKKDEISSLTQKFFDRQNKGVLDEVLNKDILKPKIETDMAKEISISFIGDQAFDSYRYMYSKLNDISDVLDERIDKICNIIKDHHQEIEYFASNRQRQQEEYYTAGKLCIDILDIMDATSTRNNENSFLLEGSRSIDSGFRTKLNFTSLANKGKSYTLFPGQVLGIKGTNVTGNNIEVTDIIEPPPLPIPATSLSELSKYYSEDKSQPISVFIASGPFTCEDSLEYEPWNELFEKYIEQEKPNVLILMGPFVDDRHPLIQEGKTMLSPEEIFSKFVSTRIQNFCNLSPHSKVILIPSNHDIVSDSVCFPQPPLDSLMIPSQDYLFDNNEERLNQAKIKSMSEKRRQLNLPINDKVLCLPNPVQFQINDVVFAISNNDILYHLYHEEVYHPASTSVFGSPSKGKAPMTSSSSSSSSHSNDRISRLTRHLLQQRSFYPLFPPAMNEANIIYEQFNSLNINMKPDVLILNSALRHFAKIVDDVVCINPGQVVQKISSTFSKLYIYPMDLQNKIKENKLDIKIKKEEEDNDNDNDMKDDKDDNIELNKVKKEEEEEEEEKVKVKKEDTNNEMDIDNKDKLLNDPNIIHEVSKRCRVEIQRV